MPLFFFDIQGDVSRTDPVGLVLADAQAAWDEALQYAADLQAERGGVFKTTSWSLVVTDADRCLVCRFDFKPVH